MALDNGGGSADRSEELELRRKVERLQARIDELEAAEQERQQARELLRESREMLRLVTDHIPHGIYWKDLDSVYLGCNRPFALMAGLEGVEDVAGKTDDDFPWSRWAGRYRDADQEVIQGDGPQINREGKYIRPDGSEGWMRTTKVPLHDGQGRVVAILGVDEDITERRRREEAMRSLAQVTFSSAGEDYFRSLTRYLAEAVQLPITYVSEIDEETGKVAQTLAVWDDDHWRENFTYPLEGTPCQKVVGTELCIFPENVQELFPDAPVLVDWQIECYIGAPLYDSNGRPSGSLVALGHEPLTDTETAASILSVFSARVGAEIERHRADRALRQSRRRYQGLFEDSPISLWEEDFSAVKEYLESLQEQGVEDLPAYLEEHPEEVVRCTSLVRVMDVNRATVELYGGLRKEQFLAGLGKIVTEESLAAMRKILVALLRGERSFETETVNSTLDGRRLVVKLRCFVARGSERPWNRLLLAITDITDIKCTEEALRQTRDELERRVLERTADLEAAHQDLKALLYIVSHDLRAPLINVKGFAGELQAACEELRGLVRRERRELSGDEQRRLNELMEEDMPEALSFIDSSVTRINHFMNTLLRLSQQGQRRLSMELIDVDAVVREALASLAYQLEQRRTVVRVGELPPVTADRISLEQIFGNILSNAVLYLDPERPGEIEVSGEVTDSAKVFHVRDNGLGIDAEDLPKVFAPFRRGPNQEVDGEGMGLAYVQALVRRHGGRIWCESEVGVGSTFSFSISSRLRQEDSRSTLELLTALDE
ncbi:MAG: ATP-binding protein [Acidobacteriota bacterium]|nr:ATP-binding protein [Acidobacteriota bacterium]